MIYTEQVRCCNCGKKAKKYCDTYYSQEEYKGNLQIITDKSKQMFDRYMYDYILWDGESYELKYEKFCTQKCALAFALKFAPEPST